MVIAPPVGFLRENKWLLAFALLIVGAVPSKEAAFALAVTWLAVLRPLSGAEVKGVLARLWPILVMLAIALFMTMVDVSREFDNRAVVRILFYYVRIPVFLMLGFGARKYMRRHTTLLWFLLFLGMATASNTLRSYLTSSGLSGLDRTTLRQIIGGGDPLSVFVPIVARILWSRGLPRWQIGVLLLAVALSLASIIVTDSRTGLLVVVLSFVLSLPHMRPLRWARWGVLAILAGGIVVTTPMFQPILDALGIDPASLGGFNEVIARPRYDLGTINTEWRGHETYMAFAAAQADGLWAFILGHGLSASANLGIFIELAPGQFFSSVDIFHNGYSFIVLHSGLLGIALYVMQMWVLARPRAALVNDDVRRDPRARGSNDEDLLYVLVLLSLAASTAVIAGMFNASTFAPLHLFLIGCFYPLRRAVPGVPRARPNDAFPPPRTPVRPFRRRTARTARAAQQGN